MSKTELIHVRVSPETKNESEKIFSKLGLNTSYAVSLFLNQVILKKSIPFSITADEISLEEVIKNNNKHRQKETKLTIMCMVYKEDGSFLVENRVKKDWPGLTFPGGHVEDDEMIEDAVIREMKEETGLDVSRLENMGHIEWNEFGDGVRHLAMLYRTKHFKGTIKLSKEGTVFFIKEKDIHSYQLSNDFEEIYKRLANKK